MCVPVIVGICVASGGGAAAVFAVFLSRRGCRLSSSTYKQDGATVSLRSKLPYAPLFGGTRP